VLKDIQSNFQNLGVALQGENKDEIASLFTNILKNFSETSEEKNDTAVDLSDDPVASADQTEDILLIGTHGSLTDTLMIASVNKDKKTENLLIKISNRLL
jgi:hypothetical protein